MRHRDFGLLVCLEQATPGFTLFSPIHGKATYLLGLRGEVVHQWEHPLTTGSYGYLLETGNLLWVGRLAEGPQHMGGRGGLLREYDWSGKSCGSISKSASITTSAVFPTETPSSSVGRSSRRTSKDASLADFREPVIPTAACTAISSTR